jgi:excisionase family DNA binding protein
LNNLLTARALADMLGVSTETVLRWARRGELPSIRLPGGAIRFDEDAVDRWLATRTSALFGALNEQSAV